MLSRMLLSVVVGIALTSVAMASPIAGFVSPGPGYNYPIEGTDGTRLHYGFGRFEGPAWTVVDGVAATTGASSEAVLYATLEDAPQQGSSITVMPTDKDWVFEIRDRVLGMTNTANDTGWILKRWMSDIDTDDYPIAGLFKTSNTSDQWKVTGGGHFETNRYPTLVDNLVLGDGVWHTWTVHYRANDQVTDTYLDGDLIASNVTRLDGVFSANMVKIESLRGTSTHEVDYVFLGQAVPEPNSVILSVMGILGLLAYAWRKRK